MKKIWVFVEGDTEDYFISDLIRQMFCNKIVIEKDLTVFVQGDPQNLTKHILYTENCRSVDNIPHRINDMDYLIERSGSKNIIIICDVEKLECPINRKKEIEKKLNSKFDKFDKKYICFNPMIESAYWECKPVITQIIKLQYKKKFGGSTTQSIILPQKTFYSKPDLKKTFKKYDLKYRETLFAKEFFPRVDYIKCKNAILKRTINHLNLILVA